MIPTSCLQLWVSREPSLRRLAFDSFVSVGRPLLLRWLSKVIYLRLKTCLCRQNHDSMCHSYYSASEYICFIEQSLSNVCLIFWNIPEVTRRTSLYQFDQSSQILPDITMFNRNKLKFGPFFNFTSFTILTRINIIEQSS